MTYDQQHPITPPPELVRHWSRLQGDTHPEALWFRIANEAAQWGADQELDACCKCLEMRWQIDDIDELTDDLRAARRPKPPSLKKQALEALDDVFNNMSEILYSSYDPPEEIYSDQADIIRRALEALPDDL